MCHEYYLLIYLRPRHRKALPRLASEFSALMHSYQQCISVALFANASIIPWHCMSKIKYLHVGSFEITTFRKVEGIKGASYEMIMQRQNHIDKQSPHFYTITDKEPLSPNLFRGIACPSCSCALPHLVWSGWYCLHCDQFHTAAPVEEQSFRLFAKMKISYSGPRMNNGKAFLDINNGAQRQLSVWNDGIKVSGIIPASIGIC